ncbi:MAG TPA: hydrogenase maturation protease [Gammaproteobacteria bacterium]|nr:hydrogenase maturation protease [Gammaproteobacteria bacterium]
MIRVIGVGHPAAGDDSVGLEIVRRLRAEPLGYCFELYEITDPMRLVDLLDGDRHVIIVDAVLTSEPPGTLHHLTPEALVEQPGIALSSHGTSVSQAIALAATLNPPHCTRKLDIIGVAIAAPGLYTRELTPVLREALPGVVRKVRALMMRRAAHQLGLQGGEGPESP